MKSSPRRALIRQLPVPSSVEKERSRYRRARRLQALRVGFRRQVKDVLFMTLGIFSAAFGLEGFLIPNAFIDGGATGIALLAVRLTELPLALLLVLVNAPFMVVAYRTIGREFALKTTAAIGGLALVTAAVHFPDVTHDKLLVAVFGGFFLGAGIGLAVRGGSVIDGTEVLALALSRKLGTTIGDIIMVINVVIFGVAAWLLGVETALYAMVTYLAASKTVDFVIEGIEEYTGLTIISPHHEEMRHMIGTVMGRGLTVYTGKRGFGKTGHSFDTEIIYCVITRLELSKILTEIEKIDPNAFVVMSPVKDTRGGMIKKRPLQH
ncbi:MAG: YitT family protein [Flavobacteriales bacterium]|nr:YitT family protein [Flavobacteriales bacterium]MBK8950609.1 YitT family protein [Flavobacteriales bacterium]MBK9699734.1 YitT family protein [Flavobacteriales bacterium]